MAGPDTSSGRASQPSSFAPHHTNVTTKISGWQVEVAPPNSATGGIYESYGRGWLIKPEEEAQKALKFGEWNTMKIRVVGGHVTTWLNGEQMVDLG